MSAEGACSAGARAALSGLRSEIETLRGLGVADMVAPLAVPASSDDERRADFSRYMARPGIATALREIGDTLSTLSSVALEAAAATQAVMASDARQVEQRVRWSDPAADAPGLLPEGGRGGGRGGGRPAGGVGLAEPGASLAPWWQGARPVVVGATGRRLPAVVLPDAVIAPADVAAAVKTSDLYYVPAWGHFAFRVGGRLFHGNVGEVKPAVAGGGSDVSNASDTGDSDNGGSGTAYRTVDCRFPVCRQRAAESRRACAFYHDPALHPGSQEVRDYSDAPSRIGASALKVNGVEPAVPPPLTAKQRLELALRADAVAHDVLVALLTAE